MAETRSAPLFEREMMENKMEYADHLFNQNANLRAENERLRDALEDAEKAIDSHKAGNARHEARIKELEARITAISKWLEKNQKEKQSER